MNEKWLRYTATDEDIYSLWYLYKEQQLKSTGVGPPWHMKRGLNARDGMFNSRVRGLICHKNVRLKVVHP